MTHLHATLAIGEHTIELGRLPPGRSGTLVDFGPPMIELVTFASETYGASLHANQPGDALHLEKWLNRGGTYERPITVSGNRAATLRLAVEEDDGG